MGIMSGRSSEDFENFKGSEVDEELHGANVVEDTSWADELAQALFDKAAEGNMSQFPAYLTTALKNDYPEDDYIMMSVLIEGSDPSLRTLRHKYADYYDWYDAM